MNNQDTRPPITVIKTDHTGKEVWRYQGVVLRRGPQCVVVEAQFNRDDMDLGYAVFRRGDRFVETFYGDRWYNIFEVHDREGGRIKGWYCNFSRPAEIDGSTVRADDLALDLYVYPDGRTLELDRDEFEQIDLDERERQAVLDALDELRQQVEAGQPPFTTALPR